MNILTVIVLSLLGIAGSTVKLTKAQLILVKPSYMVKLEIQKPSGCMVCSGSFIFKNWILTAGHCIVDAEYLVAYPAVKETVGYTLNKMNFITRTYIQGTQRYHDIALIRFPYNISCLHISPVRLPNAFDLPTAYHGKRAILNRFDSVCTGKSSVLYVAQYLTILKEQACTLGTRFFFFDEPLRAEHLCVRGSHKKVCEGDSSGHLIWEDSNEIIGVLSQPKKKSCNSEFIFTRVNFFTKFIEIVTAIDVPGGGWNKRYNKRYNSAFRNNATFVGIEIP